MKNKLKIGDTVKIVRGDIHEGKVVVISQINHSACYGMYNGTKIGFGMDDAELVEKSILSISD